MRAVLATVLILMAALGPSFVLRDLWAPDETRYFEVAREMAVTGDYLVPRLNGELYAAKPPLFFWATAAFWNAGFGQNASIAVTAIAIFVTLLATALFARRYMPSPGPVLAVLFIATIPLFLEAKAGVLDPLLTSTMVLAILSGYAALQGHRGWWIAAYIFIGLAVLTKGPVGIAVPLLVLAVYAVLDRRRVALGGWMHLWGALLMLAMVCAWLVPALLSEPGYLQQLTHEASRPVSQSHSHEQPFYYFIIMYPLVFAPWALILPLGIAAAVRSARCDGDGRSRFLLAWFCVIFIFFSAMSGKREGYLMPLMPPMALMLAWLFTRRQAAETLRTRLPRSFMYITAALIALVGVAGFALVFRLPLLVDYLANKGIVPPELDARHVLILTCGSAAFLLSGTAGLVLSGLRRMLPAVTVMLVGMLIGVFAVDAGIASTMNAGRSGREFATLARPIIAQADAVYLLENDLEGVCNIGLGFVHYPVVGEIAKTRSAKGSPEQRAEREAALGAAVRQTLEALSQNRRVAIISYRSTSLRLLGDDFAGYVRTAEDPAFHRKLGLLLNWDPQTGRLLPKPDAARIDELVNNAIERGRAMKRNWAASDDDSADD